MQGRDVSILGHMVLPSLFMYSSNTERVSSYFQIIVHIAPIILTLQFSFQTMVFKEGNSIFEIWKAMDTPIALQIYVYHVVNPNGILDGDKPIVKEKGPYQYRSVTNNSMYFPPCYVGIVLLTM